MQACVLHAIGDLRCEQVSDPVPRAGEVLVRVAACGVCGSDIPRVFKTGTYRFPLIPGHEFAGTIVSIGDGVDSSLVGTRATVFPLVPCMRCAMCATSEYALCSDYNYLGSRRDGAFAEYVCTPAWNVVPIPDHVSLEEAAMTEPAAVAIHALRQGEMKPGDAVLVMGAGPIGLLVAMWAVALGASVVILADIDERKLAFAKTLGFENVFNPRESNASDIMKSAAQAGVDVVVEASGSAAAFEQCMIAAKSFGRVVLLGNPEGDMQLSKQAYWAILRKQLRLVGSWNSSYSPSGRDDWRTAIEFMASGKLDVKPLLTHRVGLPELPAALETMRDRSEFSNKILFVNP